VAVSRAMRSLLRVREMEEDQCLAALESARGGLRRLEAALAAARERERAGRRLLASSAVTGELADRVAGIEQSRAAQRQAAALLPKLAAEEEMVALRQMEFFVKRSERRQVEALMEEAEREEAVEAEWRAQREVDDWFLNRAR
jgi:hypothetical protein